MDTVDALQYRRNTVSRSSAGTSLPSAVRAGAARPAPGGSGGPAGLAGLAVSAAVLTAPPAGSRLARPAGSRWGTRGAGRWRAARPAGRSSGLTCRSKYLSATAARSRPIWASSSAVTHRRRSPMNAARCHSSLSPARTSSHRMSCPKYDSTRTSDSRPAAAAASGVLLHLIPARRGGGRPPRLLPPGPAPCLLDEAVLGELPQVERGRPRRLAEQPRGLRRGQRPPRAQRQDQLHPHGMRVRSQRRRVIEPGDAPSRHLLFAHNAKLPLQRNLCN